MARLRGWRGSAQELADLLTEVVPDLGLLERPPNVRTLRYWRTSGVLGRSAGRGFSEREALEAVATLVFRSRGMSLDAVGETLGRRTDAELYELVREAARSASSVAESGSGEIGVFAEAAVVLLAQGVISQHEAVRAGEIVRQGDAVPEELREAMRRLGRLYIEQGDEDKAASVHGVLDRCRLPLRRWGIAAFDGEEFGYADSVLIDPDLRVPTVECEDLARSLGQGSWGTENVVERQLHRKLRDALDPLGERADRAYTSVRAFLGSRSLATLDELYGYCDEQGLPLRLSELLAREFYGRVQEAWTVGGYARRCAHCGTLLRPLESARRRPSFRCPLPACRATNDTEVGDRLAADGAMVCGPEILTYWVNPAVDELRVYRAALRAGIPCELYPDGDLCDVAIGDHIGVDVKAYASPVTLAMKLNRSVGGLARYPRRVLAVPDYVVGRRPGYLEVLEDSLAGDAATSLEVMAVSGVLGLIEEVAGARRT